MATGTEQIRHLRSPYREDAQATIPAAGGQLAFDQVPLGYELDITQITAGADDPAQPVGMVISAYANDVQAVNLIGWDLIVSPAPGIVLEPQAEPLTLRGGERVILAISGISVPEQISARLWGRLYEIEQRPWPTPIPVKVASWADPQVVEQQDWTTTPSEG